MTARSLGGMAQKTTTAAQVLGANVRRIRLAHGLGLDDVARAVRPFGLSWSTGRVALVESGQGAATVEALVGLALGLTAATGSPVTTEHLLAAREPVELGEGPAMDPGAFRDVVLGRRAAVEPGEILGAQDLPEVEGVAPETVRAAWEHWATVDTRAARRLGLGRETFLGACLRTFGRLLSQEVDTRTGPGDSPQKRGRVTRAVEAELVAAQGLLPRT